MSRLMSLMQHRFVLYMELNTSKEIDPESVVDHRSDAEGEYNEGFIETDELTSLW